MGYSEFATIADPNFDNHVVPWDRLISVRKSKAMQDYTCTLCYGTIEQGTLYRRELGMLDGDFSTSRFHLDCLSPD